VSLRKLPSDVIRSEGSGFFFESTFVLGTYAQRSRRPLTGTMDEETAHIGPQGACCVQIPAYHVGSRSGFIEHASSTMVVQREGSRPLLAHARRLARWLVRMPSSEQAESCADAISNTRSSTQMDSTCRLTSNGPHPFSKNCKALLVSLGPFHLAAMSIPVQNITAVLFDMDGVLINVRVISLPFDASSQIVSSGARRGRIRTTRQYSRPQRISSVLQSSQAR
jgi:hypothetical protein